MADAKTRRVLHARVSGPEYVMSHYLVNVHQVEVHGIHADRSSSKTRVVQNNGFNPSWNETMLFTVTCPQLALVMFRALDDVPAMKDVTIAQYCLPVRCLQTGYRMIELFDMDGERLGPSSLFVHITIDKPPA